MNWKAISYLTLIAVISGVFFSCYKTKNFSTNLTAQIDTAIVIQSIDQVRVDAILDEVFNDVNRVLSNQSAITGAGFGTDTALCDMTLALDTVDATHSISITYSSNACDINYYRGGNVTIYFLPGAQWTTPLASFGVNITNLIVHGVTDTNYLELNGNFQYVNVSGGSVATLTAGSTPVTHQILCTTGLGIIFNQNDILDTATWQVARQRVYTNNGSGISITTTGIDTVGGITNVAEWGGNRYGNSFIAAIDSPLVMSSGCGYKISSGHLAVTNPAGVTTMTYGLNSGGTATGCPASGSYYYFQTSWAGSDSDPYSAVRPYPYTN